MTHPDLASRASLEAALAALEAMSGEASLQRLRELTDAVSSLRMQLRTGEGLSGADGSVLCIEVYGGYTNNTMWFVRNEVALTV
jgi:hypothetical protein